MTDAQAIAAKLTEAQRNDLLGSLGTQFWSNDGRTARGMQRKGLIGTLDFAGRASLTPLGERVRRILTDQSEQEESNG